MILRQKLSHSELSPVCKGRLFVQEFLPAGDNLPVGGEKTHVGHLLRKGYRVWPCADLMHHILSPRAILGLSLRWDIWLNVMLTLPWNREGTGSLICNLKRNHLNMMLPPHLHESHGLEMAFILLRSEGHSLLSMFGYCQYTQTEVKINSALL